ncbi:MAG: phosphoribosylanthranilate isomerase [Treponema sp.]|jgi:phosphoribosylanthranilate isomerase|nr:phosphoribosylanthranilate isomerase [Treponema sp.]
MKIKICGLFREEDIDYANEAAPDYAGFVFAESKRHVSPILAERLRARLSPTILSVGVFVDAPVEDIAALYRGGVFSIVQLHGREDETFIRRLKTACGAPVIKAFRMNDEVFTHVHSTADYVLFDSGAGTGKVFNWRLMPQPSSSRPVFLAGGIGLENIGRAIAQDPFCIDVSSGAETNSVKDKEKMLALVRAVHLSRDVFI